ncbi:hypothetical protein AWB80_08180 [Caballeronia pedi]|uniref:Uncharacterized protein n=1 Tax=Caballeronia pedi TaxID=1777141 RepID=A0A158E4K7_9BURK|nr:hypothetical protein AWB80_08180 [Caballeronia pedi]
MSKKFDQNTYVKSIMKFLKAAAYIILSPVILFGFVAMLGVSAACDFAERKPL